METCKAPTLQLINFFNFIIVIFIIIYFYVEV